MQVNRDQDTGGRVVYVDVAGSWMPADLPAYVPESDEDIAAMTAVASAMLDAYAALRPEAS